jgi:hypothetical protein
MTNRVTYDRVEKEAMKWRGEGHDIQLKLKADGRLFVFHNDKEVLSDPGRSYIVALAKVKSIGIGEAPTLDNEGAVMDKDVQRGATSTKARAKKRATKAKPKAKKK